MFERIVVPPNEPKLHYFDLGLLAESLIFYGEVYVILDAASLEGLLQQLGPDLFLELILEEYLHVCFIDNLIGAHTKKKGTPVELYNIGFITTDALNIEIAAREAFIKATGKKGRGRRLATRFCEHIKVINYQKEIIRSSLTKDMQDGIYLEEYIRRLIKRTHTSTLNNLDQITYRFLEIPGQGFQLQSNLNLHAIREAGIDTVEFENPASILAQYAKVVADMSLWAELNSEAALTPRQADVLSSRIDKLLEKYTATASSVSTFQDFLFDDARTIRESINQGNREFREILPVVQRGRRFREWLSAQPPDTELLKAYHREVTADSWISRLPGKIARWSLFTGTGVGIDLMGGGGVGTVGGIILSLLDTFFLDKIVKGWKPNQFVEGPLTRFLEY